MSMQSARVLRINDSKAEATQDAPVVASRSSTPAARSALLHDAGPAISLSDHQAARAPASESSSSQSAAVSLGHGPEQQADRAAETALRLPILSAPAAGTSQSSNAPVAAPASSSHPGLGGGRPLSAPIRTQFESAYGWDFSPVRIHTGSAATDAATRAGARAFTSGHDIAFGEKVSDPESGTHRRVLAHELAHVVQQGKSAGGPPANRGADLARAPSALAKSLSAAPSGQLQADPVVSAVVPAALELGVGRTLGVTATAAGRGTLDWTVMAPAPAGVTVVRSGARGATIQSTAASIASAGAVFRVQAALRGAAPPDNHSSANITLVGITGVAFNPNPAFQATIATNIPPPTPSPANTADPNRAGLAGNTAAAVPTVAPVARPAGFTLSLLAPLGASAAGLNITPGVTTGNIRVRVMDNATQTFRDVVLPVSPVPTSVTGFTAQAAVGAAGMYGCFNTIGFGPSHSVPAAAFNRAIGETIATGGRDDFLIVSLPGMPLTLVPLLAQSAPANSWSDNVSTSIGPVAGAAGDANTINVNRYVGPGVAAGLPRVSIDRQGFHFLGWAGTNWSGEFAKGIHQVTLRARGAGHIFVTEHILGGIPARPFVDPYAGPPLIVFTGITNPAPAAPPAAQLAADGAATANLNVAPPLPAGRLVNWSVVGGPLTFTVPAAGAAIAVANPATVQAGLVPGNFRIRVNDSVFPNRRFERNIQLVPVRLHGIAAPVVRVPPATLTTLVNVLADPGGRIVDWVVDPISSAAGVAVAPNAVAGPAVAAPGRAATVTKPNAAWTGRVTVTGNDRALPGKRQSIVIVFL